MAIGSSPRLWGTLKCGMLIAILLRFIPTPVGNSFSFSRPQISISVHPHACGELLEPDHKLADRIGSSPRLWGTQFAFSSHVKILRFIPTPVGNSSLAHFIISASSVHPHACGELCSWALEGAR